MPPSNGAAKILVVDDSEATLEVIRRNLQGDGFGVLTAADVAGAIEHLDSERVGVVVTDVKMPRVSGLELARHVRDNHPQIPVVVITGYPDVDSAIRAFKDGAVEYLRKPFTDEELLTIVRRAVSRREFQDPEDMNGEPSQALHGIVGESHGIRRVRAQIEKAAKSSATVLITGESGTGKELVARAIHYAGKRAAAPFVPVNCGAIPQELLETELFGHVKGAYTGAHETRAGFFLTADGGTIFLDEIAETSPAMQVRLLRVLQERAVQLVGSSNTRSVDVRVVAASNKDLLGLVREGRFREDLYYRLNVLCLDVPPLRERGGDVLHLTHHFLAQLAAESGRPPLTLADRVVEILEGYSWPGNVRELENLLQRWAVMAEDGTVLVSDLPALMRYSLDSVDSLGDVTLAELEVRHIKRVLDRVDGNKSHAAKILGIDRKTLRAKLRTPKGC